MPIQDAENVTQNTQNEAEAGLAVGSVYFVHDSGRVKTLLAELLSAGVVLSVKGDQLAFDAPAGVITDDLLGRMKSDRDGLMAALAGVPVDPVPVDPVAVDPVAGEPVAGEPVDPGGDHGGVGGSRPRVVHLKAGDFDPRNPAYVRIDRKSRWGNPFVMDKPGRPADGDRVEVIEKYRAWIVGQSELMTALPELRGKVLGCWCAPAACHGDVLADLVEALDDPAEPAADAMPGPVVATSIRCPFCGEIDLADDPGGLRCCHCDRLAWVATVEGGLARRDVADSAIELIDPDSVPVCPSCGRWCGVMTLAESWRCSRCDPEADDRRRRTLRVLSLVSRSRG